MTDKGTQLGARSLRRLFAQGNEPPSNHSKQSGRNASNAASVFFEELPNDEEQRHRYVVSGAIFLAGIFVFFAYLCIKRNQQ
jgi:hypothetical protein